MQHKAQNQFLHALKVYNTDLIEFHRPHIALQHALRGENSREGDILRRRK